MIHDVDASIRALIRRDAIDGDGDVEVAFVAPTSGWAAERTTPTIDVYLYDLHEDRDRRRTELLPVLSADGVVVGRRRPPRYFRLSYLVTAWAQEPEHEHRLLAAVLHAFLPHDALPRDLLQGALAAADATVYASIGCPSAPSRTIGDLWTAIGGELRPSLDLVLTAPFVVDETRPAGPPVREEPRFTFQPTEGSGEQPRGRGRTRKDPTDEDAPDGAVAGISETVHGGRGDEGRQLTITTIER